MKVIGSGILKKVETDVTKAGKEYYKLYVVEPAAISPYTGEKMGNDNVYVIACFKGEISIFKDMINRKVDFTAFLNSFAYESENQTKYMLSLNFSTMQSSKFQPDMQKAQSNAKPEVDVELSEYDRAVAGNLSQAYSKKYADPAQLKQNGFNEYDKDLPF